MHLARLARRIGDGLGKSECAVLHEFIQANREQILAASQTLVATGHAPAAAVVELDRGVPTFVDQLLNTLAGLAAPAARDIEKSSRAHGADLLGAGFSYSQVVHHYGSVCQEVTWLAHKMNVTITPDEFRTLNRCLDDAIAGAVTEFARLREAAIEHVESEHVGVLAHELRTPLAAALLSYQVLKTGTISAGGSTGTELGRNLRRVSALIDRTVARVRLDAGAQMPERLSVFAFIEKLEVGAALEANAGRPLADSDHRRARGGRRSGPPASQRGSLQPRSERPSIYTPGRTRHVDEFEHARSGPRCRGRRVRRASVGSGAEARPRIRRAVGRQRRAGAGPFHRSPERRGDGSGAPCPRHPRQRMRVHDRPSETGGAMTVEKPRSGPPGRLN